MWVVWVAQGWAAPVVVDGVDPAEAVARVAAVDASFPDPEVVDWQTVRSVGPTVLEGGSVARCAGAARPGWLARAVADARGRIAYGEWDEALAALRDAEVALPCAPGESVGADLSAVFALRGVASFHLGRIDDARTAFASLRAVDPTWTWDAALSPQARTVFDAVRPAAPAELRVAGGAVRVNGRVAPDSIVPGWHLVQAADPAAAWGVVVRPGNRATVVLPERFPVAAPSDVGTDVGALFAAAFGEGVPVALVTATGTWIGVAGRSDGRFVAVAPTDPGDPPVRRSKAPWAVGLVGSGVGAGFGALALVSLAQAGAASDDYQAALTGPDAAAAKADHADAASQLRWSRWVALGGGILAGAGFGVYIAGSVRATPTGIEARF